MTVANDSILVTPGSGATVATHLANAKEHQAVVVADQTGHVLGSKETWIAYTGNTIHVAAARTTLFDLFNDTGSGVLIFVHGLYVIPALAAVSGVGQTYEAIRTSAVGTGGTTITPAPFDSTNAALPAGVTARTKPAGGATTAATLLLLNGSSEETNPYAALASMLNHIPSGGMADPQRIVLREGQGLKVDQTTNSAIGNVNVMVMFTVE
jgi:hypothetical protein